MDIEENKAAPAFTLKDQNGKDVSLSDHRGKTVVLYFYPKDDTPGCTKESCGFRDNTPAFNAIIIGVSPDGAESHTQFIEKFNLPFTLLSDPEKVVMSVYKAWGEKMMYGKKLIGTIRSTVVIGPDGKVLKHWKKVPKAADHPDKVLAYLQSLQD
ncbi:MAG: redoxin domain-containing protein [Gammaproteobacteria bacterium]|nr:redoxin domain-containing protein [Gammaproteobacteria bacterium]